MVLLAWACASDLRRRRIPNALVLAILASGFVRAVAPGAESPGVLGALGGFALGLAIWLPFHALGVLGAGDVKLVAAAGAWLGPLSVLNASMYGAIAGALVALVTAASQGTLREVLSSVAVRVGALQQGRWLGIPPISRAKHQMPYGVALAIGIALAWWAR
ncbi:MAG TPA: prepilin peptidase [Gemmatimonadaceae bacterium]|nr:prepilin peptidase [Gemmatimonadaceae bacterium]